MAESPAAPTNPLRADRFLVGILIGIVTLLMLAVLVVVLVQRQPVEELSADRPAGTVQRFVQALERNDYPTAYSYLSESMARRPTREQFERFNAEQQGTGRTSARLRLEREAVTGDTATVTVQVTRFTPGGLFSRNEWRTTETFSLRRESAGWRITDLPYQYWPPAVPH